MSAQTPTPTPVSDIAVVKSTDDETVIPGGQISYQIVVTNAGPDTASNVRLSDPIPAHTTYVSADASQGSVNLNGNVLEANFGTVAPDTSVTLQLRVSVNSDTAPGTTITNTVNVTSDSADSDLTNNQASASSTVVAPAANLTVVKIGPDTADVGGPISYTIQVVNFGPLDALNVVLMDPIPAHTTFDSALPSQGSYMLNGNTVVVNFGTIPSGSSATLLLTVIINGDTTRNTVITNTATATSDTVEGNPEDNSSTAITVVTGVFPGDLIISEFRLRGPGPVINTAPQGDLAVLGRPAEARGSNSFGKPAPDFVAPTPQALDEFVEIYNNTDSPITVNTFDDSLGFAVAASDGVTRFVIPNGTTIPARGHFLGVNSGGYSLGQYPSGNDGFTPTTATGDATYQTDIPDNAGIALFRTSNSQSFSTSSRLDAVGSTAEANTLYKEGTGYPALTPQSVEYSFFRDSCGKGGSTTNPLPCTQFTPKDTNNNASDFVFVDTDGTNLGAGQRLGAPGPENLTSPIQNNGGFAAALLDATKSNDVAPNRVRDLTADPVNNSPFGTLDIRRRITNTTGEAVTRLRFRIIDISTFFSPVGTADLRARTSPTIMVSGINDPQTCGGGTPCAVTVRGLTLETPPAQPLGGGFNSTLSDGVVTLQTPLQPGESINVHFLFGVQQNGRFRVIGNIEALTGVQGPPSKPQTEGISTKAP